LVPHSIPVVSRNLKLTGQTFNSAEKEFNVLINTLEASPQFVVVESAEEWDDEERPPQPEEGEVFKVPGSIVSIVDRLDDELTRSLQHIDPHTTEYIERLSDEGTLYTSILRSQLYLERLHSKQGIPSDESLNRVIMRRLDHVYFKVYTPSPLLNMFHCD
jgi:translation initiation factor 3 subunit C